MSAPSAKTLVGNQPYSTLKEVEDALREVNFEACELIVGVDFTKSNTWNGKKSFDGKLVHVAKYKSKRDCCLQDDLCTISRIRPTRI